MEIPKVEEEKKEMAFGRQNGKRSVNLESTTSEKDLQQTNTEITDEIYETMLPDDKIVDFTESPKALFDLFDKCR